jgi:hypothetical protein
MKNKTKKNTKFDGISIEMGLRKYRLNVGAKWVKILFFFLIILRI